MSLFNLPQSLAIVLVTDWIDWKGLSKLDAAACDRNLRPKWWSFIGDEVAFFPDFPVLKSEVACSQFMAWSLRRTVKIQKLLICDKTPFADLPLCASYLQLQLPRLCAITFKRLQTGAIPAEICLLLSSCPRIWSIRVLWCTGLGSIGPVIASAAAQLEELHFHCCCMSPGTGSLFGLTFPRLQDFYVNNCTQLPDFLQEQVCSRSPTLTRLTAFGQLTDTALTNLSAHCGRLQIASLSGCRGITDSGLAPFLQLCSSLVTCDICCNDFVGDASVLAVVRNCPALRALAIGGNASFSDASAVAIAQYAGKRLQVLHLGRRTSITDAGVTHLAQYCTALYSLLVTSQPNRIRGDLLAKWVSKCPAMEFLDVGRCASTKVVLAAAAKCCPRLQLLNLYEAQISVEALQEVARGCPLLRTVAVHRHSLRTVDEQELKQEFPLLDVQNTDVTIPFWAKFSYTFTDPM